MLTPIFAPRCDTMDKMKHALPMLRAQLEDPSMFKEVYQFTFNFARSEGQKSLRGCRDVESERSPTVFFTTLFPLPSTAPEVAVAYWDLLLSPKYPLAESWIEYINVSGLSTITPILAADLTTARWLSCNRKSTRRLLVVILGTW